MAAVNVPMDERLSASMLEADKVCVCGGMHVLFMLASVLIARRRRRRVKGRRSRV